MKKAVIEQFLLGFILILGTLAFVATSADEYSTRNKLFDLKNIAMQTGKSMAKSYEQNMDMCFSKTISENILSQSALGQELLRLQASGDITFEYDFYDFTGTGDQPDGQPDQVRVSINGYTYKTFWYRFFDKNSFTFDAISEQFNVDTPKDVTIRYGNRPTAAYQNMLGTYQLDANNCITNMQMYMANSLDDNKWQKTDSDGNRIAIADGIESPPTYVFAIANGNRHYDQPADNAAVQLNSPHCFGSNQYPDLTINNVDNQATVGNTNSGNVFFEQKELNADGAEHFHIIPQSILSDYIYYKTYLHNSGGNEKDKYEAFKQYADALNADANDANDINYTSDPNDEYHYALEDLDAADSDMDFTDMLLDSTRLVKINDTDQYTVNNDHKIVFDTGYCENDIENIPPTLTLTGCPVTVNEDTSTNVINWIASDTDGTIESKEASTNNGQAIINANGTITYTPDLNFYGEDTITVVVRDDDDAVSRKECQVNIIEINDIPTITGTPVALAQIGETYIFLPDAEDVDGDVLTFSIQNKPDWASFNAFTGQLSGIPSSSDTGTFTNIIISVSDGRGGSASLPTFSIQVVGTNAAPTLVTPIPDHNAIEDNTYTYNLVPHFEDPDGDTLTYTISVSYGGSTQTLNAPNGIISISIPDGRAGITARVVVVVSDGQESVTDEYLLTITSNSDCNGPFESTFTGIDDGWNRGDLTSNDNYRLDGGYQDAYVQHNFGQGCKNTNIRLTFKYKTNNNWEDSDKFDLYINGSFKAKYEKTNTNWIDKSEVVQTDNNGWLTIQFFTNNNNTDEKARIDNVKAEKE